MSAAATWSTEATPLARVAGAVVHILGLLCIVHAAVTLALGGAAWNLPATFCLGLGALLGLLQALRRARRAPHTLVWDAVRGCFVMSGRPQGMALIHAWHGSGWMTLRLRPLDAGGPAYHAIIWKSAVPAPLWSELALRVEAGRSGGTRHQNKENP